MKSNEKLNGVESILLMLLWQMPYASAEDLKMWPMVSSSRVYPSLRSLVKRGFIGYETLGWMRDAQRRYFLLDEGVELAMQKAGCPIHWAVTDSGRATVRSYGPMMECVYHVAPQFWRPGWMRESIISLEYEGLLEGPDDDRALPHEIQAPIPDSFTWLRQGPLAALVGMQQGPDVNPFWVPLIWYGTHPPKSSLPDNVDQIFSHLETEFDREWQLPCSPTGVVIVAVDFLAAARAAREFPPTFPRMIIACKAAVSQQRRFGIGRVESSWVAMFPHGYGRVLEANQSVRLPSLRP